MVSTVTTATVATLTTLASSIALVGICTLLVLLVQKELTLSSRGHFARALGQVLRIGIVPLLIAFVLIVAMRVAEALK